MSIEHESGNSVLIDIQGMLDRELPVMSLLFVGSDVLVNEAGDKASDDDDILLGDDLLGEHFKKSDDISPGLWAEVELRLYWSRFESTFPNFIILSLDIIPVLLSKVISKLVVGDNGPLKSTVGDIDSVELEERGELVLDDVETNKGVGAE